MSGIFEELVADIGIEANGFKKLAVTVAGDSRNSHAGQHLAKAFFHARTIARRSVCLMLGGEFHGQIGMNSTGARSNQQRNMVGINYLPGLDDQGNIPCACFNHGVPYGRKGK